MGHPMNKNKNNKLGLLLAVGIAVGAAQANAQTNLVTGITELDEPGEALATTFTWGKRTAATIMVAGLIIGWFAAARRRRV